MRQRRLALAFVVLQGLGGSWSALGSGLNNAVNALAILATGVYAGGTFTIAGTNVTAYLGQGNLSVNSPPTDTGLVPSSVDKNRPIGTTVGSFNSTDPDAGNAFAYNLTAGAGDDDNGAFRSAGNTLQSAATFVYETRNSYRIRVRSTDQGELFFEKQLTIAVNNMNEPPIIAAGGTAILSNHITRISAVKAGPMWWSSAAGSFRCRYFGYPSRLIPWARRLPAIPIPPGDQFRVLLPPARAVENRLPSAGGGAPGESSNRRPGGSVSGGRCRASSSR